MKVLKFGGTSVGSAANIKQIINIIKNEAKTRQIVVVSAFSQVTNLLIDAAKLASIKEDAYQNDLQIIKDIHYTIVNDLFPNKKKSLLRFIDENLGQLEKVLESISHIGELSAKSEAIIESYGELLSSHILTETFKEYGLDTILKDSRELIRTNSNYANASVYFSKTENNIQQFFTKNNKPIVVVPGFIAANEQGETTLLGRGGSDYSAAIFAGALKAECLEKWTDVDGMFTANPNLVKQALPIKNISYEEAMELSHFGAKVIYPPTIHPVLQKNIPIYIKNTTRPNERGTKISSVIKGKKNIVKGISHTENVSLITLEGSGMVGIPGFSKRLFETLSAEKINIKLITQASSEHSICIAIDDANAAQAKLAIDQTFELEILKSKLKPLIVEQGLAIIAIVGEQMKSHQGISGKMFSTLGKNNVNIRAIAQGASERNISAVIAAKDIKKALNSLHEAFFTDIYKQVNLFITGIGNVGGKLIEQIAQQQDFLLSQLKINMRVVGISNSRKMVFCEEGLNLANYKKLLEKGENANLQAFLEQVIQLNLRNSIFVDITASENVANMYADYLKNSIAVVACNKIASSSAFKKYKNLKNLSMEYNAPYLFETNVGAGLPVIDTLNNLIASGDSITRIEAVLSGSLNFIFNHYNKNNTFYEVVKQAREEGYTEPDPGIDLSGIDVARKILILVRESGQEMELEDVTNKTFLSPKSTEAKGIDSFFKALKEDENHYKNILAKADKNKAKLKYVASYENGEATVGLQEIPANHPFYNLEGKDNIVMFYTKRYPEQPMIIKGAGAGADVTASGLFADIIKIGNRE
ncbi:MAG: bifunctional aspartate kinase/homoserine dehydrogenase I [Flavobacteriales bacterium]|nr:MAG: bifunctional aspartate kinase/homoserine dehydrogenase I [Flavobacteriales bacterium]